MEESRIKFLMIVALTVVCLFCGTPSVRGVLAVEGDVPVLRKAKPALERFRDGIPTFLDKVKKGEPVKVAYFGGSITAADGWRVQTLKKFNEEYSPSVFTEINAAIGGTGSDLGVYRCEHDVLQYDPDLVFVEFCVNDGGTPPEMIWRQFEGIVRQIWKHNLRTDIVFVYTFRVGHEKNYLENDTPRSVAAMEQLADFYGVPSLDFNIPVVELEQAGKLVFQSEEPVEGKLQFSTDGVHPLDKGHEIYTKVVFDAFEKMKAENLKKPYLDPGIRTEKLDKTFISDNFENAKLVPIKESQLSGAWKPLPGDSALSWMKSRLGDVVYVSEVPGSRLTIKFKGSRLSIYDVLGPNGGQVNITVDGVSSEKPCPRFDSFCTYWRLATLVVASDLDPNVEHEAIIEIDEEEPSRQPVAFRLENPEKELAEPKYHGHNVWFGPIMIIGDVLD